MKSNDSHCKKINFLTSNKLINGKCNIYPKGTYFETHNRIIIFFNSRAYNPIKVQEHVTNN